MGKTKKQLEQIVLKKRQYRSRQGRSERQYEDSMRIMTAACLALGLVVIGLIIYGILS